MIRPAHFGYNVETSANNTFQQKDGDLTADEVARQAKEEFDAMVEILRMRGVHVDVFEDTDSPEKPDAVFPNNWFSTHQDGVVITYPMFSPLRRQERRQDLLDALDEKYHVARRYAFETFEDKDLFLEGTGSLILDRTNKVVYACLSDRTDIRMLDKWCVLRGFRSVSFVAVDAGVRIYHTNVVMMLGDSYSVICLDCISDTAQREEVKSSLQSSGRELIEISTEQMNEFAGNMLQLDTVTGDPICVMSSRAYESLVPAQIAKIEKYNQIVHIPLNVIEKYGGGSVRCMIAENFLEPKRNELLA